MENLLWKYLVMKDTEKIMDVMVVEMLVTLFQIASLWSWQKCYQQNSEIKGPLPYDIYCPTDLWPDHTRVSLSLSFSPWGLSGRGPWEGDWFITVFKWNCTFIRLVSHPSSIKLLLPQLLFGVTQFFLRSPTLCIITSYCKISNSFSITSFCCFDKSLSHFFQQKSSSAV